MRSSLEVTHLPRVTRRALAGRMEVLAVHAVGGSDLEPRLPGGSRG